MSLFSLLFSPVLSFNSQQTQENDEFTAESQVINSNNVISDVVSNNSNINVAPAPHRVQQQLANRQLELENIRENKKVLRKKRTTVISTDVKNVILYHMYSLKEEKLLTQIQNSDVAVENCPTRDLTAR